MKKLTLLFAILISLITVQISFAAPSLTITKPPVKPIPSWTGPGAPPLLPPGDPDAIYGQWFVDRATGAIFTNRTHEFYDNIPGFGGGYQGSTAIYGYVTSVSWGGAGTPITAFEVDAKIYNDIFSDTPWLYGTNSHSEWRDFKSTDDQKMAGDFLDVKLVAEFSVDSGKLPSSWTYPYVDRNPHIEAVNHDELAWYCWTDDPQAPKPSGDFYVPTWDFGFIPQGGFAGKSLSFQIPTGLPATDPRYTVITNSLATQADIFVNRTSSLKISDWIEDLVTDTGLPYQDTVEHGSDVSVFHSIPEPGIIAGFSLIILGLYRRIK